MITLNGTIDRTFYFPADPATTLAYFSDLSRVVYFLPHISLVEAYSSLRVRVRYQTVELGAYTINIFCDLDMKVDADAMVVHIHPWADGEIVPSEATLNTTVGYGYYTSHARLMPDEDGTKIKYSFKFQSKLPRPRGLRMMPRRVVDRIAHSISMGRVEEIADGFMSNALEAFDSWLSEQNGSIRTGAHLKVD